MYNCSVSRRLIVAFVGIAIITIWMGALVYEVFDIHDPKPFPIDPEFLVMTCSALLALCLSTVLAIRLFGLCLLFWESLSQGLSELAPVLWRRFQTFEVKRLLFSPPLSAISIRI
jgi:hypothetical protein